MDNKKFSSCACNELTKISKKDSLLFIFKKSIIKILLFSISSFFLFSMILHHYLQNTAYISPYFFPGLLSTFLILQILFFVIIYKKNANFIKEIVITTNLLQVGLHQIQHCIKPIKINYDKKNEFGQLCKIYKNLSAKIKEKTLENNINDEKRRVVFSGIIHDNKTLLSTLLGYSEALQINKNLSEEKKNKYISGICSCAEDLCELNETLSIFNKLSDSNIFFDYKPVNFGRAVYNIVNPVIDLLPLKKVSISMELDENTCVMLDVKSFKRVLLNLLANTIRYRTKEFSKITLKSYRDGNFVVFSYSDDGPGVSETDLPHLFEAYYRNPDTKKTIKGSGLGLAIVAKIIEAHQGTYEAISDNGLTIIFRIPLIESEDFYD